MLCLPSGQCICAMQFLGRGCPVSAAHYPGQNQGGTFMQCLHTVAIDCLEAQTCKAVLSWVYPVQVKHNTCRAGQNPSPVDSPGGSLYIHCLLSPCIATRTPCCRQSICISTFNAYYGKACPACPFLFTSWKKRS